MDPAPGDIGPPGHGQRMPLLPMQQGPPPGYITKGPPYKANHPAALPVGEVASGKGFGNMSGELAGQKGGGCGSQCGGKTPCDPSSGKSCVGAGLVKGGDKS